MSWRVVAEMSRKSKNAVTGQRSNQLNYVPHFVFLPLSETRVFTGFPQVQSSRLRRPFETPSNQIPRLMDTMDTKLNHVQNCSAGKHNPEQLSLPRD